MPPGPIKTNVPMEPLRWSVKRAAVEFATSVMTLRKLLVKVGVAPGSDGCFSTAEISKAVFGGGLAEEKLLTQRQLTRRYELDNQITESRVLDKAALMAGLSQISDAMVSIISTSGLSREAKEDLQRELAGIPIVLDDVATRQSKLPRNQNGQKDTGDEDDG